jgi:hypothetical protein
MLASPQAIARPQYLGIAGSAHRLPLGTGRYPLSEVGIFLLGDYATRYRVGDPVGLPTDDGAAQESNLTLPPPRE